MELVASLIDIVLRLDVHLAALVERHGVWIYAILFAIIFSETGFVVTPFLPGDSLLFVAGTIAAVGGMNVHVLVVSLVLAAFLGNMVNYAIGRWLARVLFKDRRSRWLNPKYLDMAHAFYERHGGKAIVISRFLPIVRTYVPFVAGMGAMQPMRFTAFNLLGGVLWVASLCYAGYLFGNIPWIKQNLTVIIVAIIVVSLLPVIFAWARARFA